MPDPSSQSAITGHRRLFPSTIWSAISQAREEDDSGILAGLERLGQMYWHPLYVFVRHRGMNPEDAADAVQGFFEHLLSREVLRSVSRRDSRFRTFLLRCFTNWLISGHRKQAAQRRGGGRVQVDWSEAEPHLFPAYSGDSAEASFDRKWAETLFGHARTRLDEELAARDRPEMLQEIRGRVFAPGDEGPRWAEVAERHQVTEGAVRKAAMDLRSRFAVILRQEVGALVSDESEVEDELRHLFQLLAGTRTA